MSFRPVGLEPQYFTLNGSVLTVVAGGSLTFTLTGTTTPQATYSDKALTIANTNPVILDAYGRPETDIWGTGIYRVVLKDSNGAALWSRDDVQGNSDLPDQTTNFGKFLTTDGANLSWSAIVQIPSMTGNSGKFLTTDGSSASWTSLPGTFTNLQITRQTVVAATTTNIDYSLGGVVKLTQDTAITSLTFTNLAATGKAMFITIRREKDATGTSRAITWPASFKWPAGVAPVLTQTTGAKDVITIESDDGGTTWYGSYNCGLA